MRTRDPRRRTGELTWEDYLGLWVIGIIAAAALLCILQGMLR